MTIEEWLGKENKLGIDMWHKKYQFGNETFDEWLDRVSSGSELLKRLIVEKKFIPGGRILSNRGLDKIGKKITLSNCYVVEPPEDNLESIFNCASKLARTYSYGGGCGVDVSKLAPEGAAINNAAKSTSGATSFMELFHLVTDLIGQNGRRGALMISMSCEHPDLEKFISIKSDLTKLNKANISVRVTDDFMNAVKNNAAFVLHFERPETGECIKKTVNARDIFRKICEMNWDNGEPGMLFWDTICDYNLLSEDLNFEYAGTNPCAEEPLPAGGSCLLGSLNLSEFVDTDGRLLVHELESATAIAVDALNGILDEGLQLHPLDEQRKSVYKWRQIGLGIMGLADMLIKLGVQYGSVESVELCDRIGKIIINAALRESSFLAKYYGTYPAYDETSVLKSSFFKANADEETIKTVEEYGLRNSQLLTIAPTGSISTMLGVSGGIEPVFANSYTRKTESVHGHDEYYKIYTPIVKCYMDVHNLSDEAELPDFFITADKLNYENRLQMQAVWQKHIDASISSTVNVPNDFTVEDVMKLYFDAWLYGLKGVTMFRDGCSRSGVLTTNSAKTNDSNPELKRGEVIKVNDSCVGLKRTLTTGCGTLHVEAFFDPSTCDLREIYLSKGSTGGCNNFMIGLSRQISLSARGGMSIENIVDQLMSSGTCPSYARRTAMNKDTSKGSSCPVAIGYALLDMHDTFKRAMGYNKNVDYNLRHDNATTCPECGSKLTFTNGCVTCLACGWTKCDT